MNGSAGSVALFGGTFDPIHDAHLEVAREAADKFSLSKVLFVPAFNPPHKESAKASFADRVRMCELACGVDPRFEVSRVEEGSERSYSILTIEKLRGLSVAPLSFLIGADAFAEVRSWHRWREVAALVEFLVVTRPGAMYEVSRRGYCAGSAGSGLGYIVFRDPRTFAGRPVGCADPTCSFYLHPLPASIRLKDNPCTELDAARTVRCGSHQPECLRRRAQVRECECRVVHDVERFEPDLHIPLFPKADPLQGGGV